MLNRRLTTSIKFMRGKVVLSNLEADQTLRFTIKHLQTMLRAVEAEMLREYERSKPQRKPKFAGTGIRARRQAREAAAKAANQVFDGLKTGQYSLADLQRMCAALPQ